MLNIPDSPHKRIVIIGAGFAGLNLAKNLRNTPFQVVLLDRNNHHQFQPLYYQVAMAGLEPSSISFPLRKLFQEDNNITIRLANVLKILTEKNRIETDHGEIYYDYLVMAMGAKTNFYGNHEIEEKSFGLKSVSEALFLRNAVFEDLEKSLTEPDYAQRQKLIDIAIVGGGPTGVELAGALAEMKKFILPRDYRELNADEVDIFLIQSGDRLLPGMSKKSSDTALVYLEKLGVQVLLNQRVTAFDGERVTMDNGNSIPTKKVIWAAGITCSRIDGFDESQYTYGNRLKVDGNQRLEDFENIFAIGDQAYTETKDWPRGHPQVAQVAIQQAKHLSKVLLNKTQLEFVYKDLGSMATIGRNKAVVDLPKFTFKGFSAWVLWLVVHIRSLIGVRNRLIVMFNWLWNYITYDQSLRIIIKPFKKDKKNLKV